MTKHIIEGSVIEHIHPLNVERVGVVDEADGYMIAAGVDGWINHAAPGLGFCWTIDSALVGFDIMPTAAFRLEIWYNIGAGNVVVFDSWVGAAPAANGTDVNTMGVAEMIGPVSRRFPEDAQVRLTLYSGDAAVAPSLNIVSRLVNIL